MKRRSQKTAKPRGKSPYCKYNKKEYNYTPMYRAILTHEPNSEFAKHLRERRKIAV